MPLPWSRFNRPRAVLIVLPALLLITSSLVAGPLRAVSADAPAVSAPAKPARIEPRVEARARRGEVQELMVALHAPAGRSPRELEPWQEALRQRREEVVRCAALEDRHVLRAWTSIPMLFLRLEPAALARLAACPGVEAIGANGQSRAALAESLPLIEAAVARQETGFTGAGATVAILDSGVDYTHPELGGCLGDGCRVVGGRDFGDGDNDPMDCGGRHGTNVAAIAAGTGGVAPGAQVAALKVFKDADCSTTTDDVVADALDWVVANRRTYNLKAVNISLGRYNGGYTAACDQVVGYGSAVSTVHDAGVLVVAAAGNEALPKAVDYPACHSKAMAVANAYDSSFASVCWGSSVCATALCEDRDTEPDTLACSSNGGALVDVAAPGTFIQAAGLELAGTSQAAPHVAGAAAVLAEAFPGASADALWAALATSSDRVDDQRAAPGYLYPRLNLSDALDAFEDGDGDGFPRSGDCLDSDETVYPGAVELCDDLDNDCDGAEDEGLEVDSDRDGYTGCYGDCDDSDASINPEGTERADGKDNDCDGEIDDGFGPGDDTGDGCGCETRGRSGRGGAALIAGILLARVMRRARRRDPGDSSSRS